MEKNKEKFIYLTKSSQDLENIELESLLYVPSRTGTINIKKMSHET